MTNPNPLLAKILELLQAGSGSLRDYEIILALEKDGCVLSTEKGSLALFQKNFVLRNALYLLQEQLLEDGFYLSISLVMISLQKITSTQAQQVGDVGLRNLREYYLDWSNCELASEQGVEDLISGFWDKYTAYQNKDSAFEVLGVTANHSWADIKQCYRKLAAQAHPDKGGNAEEFMRLREAYEALKLAYK